MSRPIPFRHSSPTTRTHLSKAQLLPIPREVASELALQAHLSLEALRAGATDIRPAQHVTEAMFLAKFLADAGHGEFSDEELASADLTMAAVFDAAHASGLWMLPASEFEKLAAIVSLYDCQLKRATLAALTMAGERLEQFKAGGPFRQSKRRQA
jgi:hypothetical protein